MAPWPSGRIRTKSATWLPAWKPVTTGETSALLPRSRQCLKDGLIGDLFHGPDSIDAGWKGQPATWVEIEARTTAAPLSENAADVARARSSDSRVESAARERPGRGR